MKARSSFPLISSILMFATGLSFAQGTVVRCSSDDGRRHSCPANTRGGVQLTRQISGSACIQASTWGVDGSGIWVDHGCRAEFMAYSAVAVNPAGTITCSEETGYFTKRCPADTGQGVQLLRQVSGSPCTFNSTWGYDSNSIWVSRGCRAEFALGAAAVSGVQTMGAPQSITCTSDDGRRHTCPTNTSGTVQLNRQISGSACIQGSTWGYDAQGIWVDRGCRAEFLVYPDAGGSNAGTITCSENTGVSTSRCAVDTSRGVLMVRQLSGSPCTLNSTWGYDTNGIWVSRGCRAEFALGGTSALNEQVMGGGQAITCSSDDERRHTCPIDVRGGVQLTRQISGSACTQGSSWGYDQQGIWVDRGCRAEFMVTPYSATSWNDRREITCSSDDGTRHYCQTGPHRRIELRHQLSGSPCMAGQSWGEDANGVWVDRGCRAVFRVR